MQTPQTPSRAKADREIEAIKRSLSEEWGLIFPPFNALNSPSRNDASDEKPLEDKVHGWIQFLYWRRERSQHGAGGLSYALNEFAHQAPSIVSAWKFKPGADPQVLPSRHMRESQVKVDFLHKRPYHKEKEAKDLMECLYNKLSLVGGKVKKDEVYYIQDDTAVRTSVEQPLTPKTERRSKDAWPRYRIKLILIVI